MPNHSLFSKTFFRTTQKLKKLITPHNRSFFCDSHPRLCMACIRVRFKLMGLNPYVPHTDMIPVVTRKGLYAWKKSWASKWYPLRRIGPREFIAKVFSYWEYVITDPCKVVIRSELPVVKAHIVVKTEK